MKKLILASQSLGRRKVLEDAGFVFEVFPSNYIEDMTLPLLPHELATHLSRGKAQDVAQKNPEAIVIGADTFVVYEGKLLGKPLTKENARKMLKLLSGSVHAMLSGLTVIHAGREITKLVETKIWFKSFSEKEIDEYVETGESLEKAGGYAYQGVGKKFVERIEGSETNILGLPIEVLKEVLQEFGVAVLK
ncbi:MAG: septum formation protein Maf [Candidatus Taylorbacteria bacterium RIFCSPHIGHO2_01_FULL_46_22b]|uniref:Nucleoside triphosphate pyrophosphatase n=1 Tax=Candidatus Taylorbacteria bacterium RIFCSPHIGHO2_01_FULL_46_22b TaxID=1802301 RepID=A0A1G2M4F2_9BACT|nr:MAG: septum formation protein Maf [Candidatus Taylorbacteria bacterium RIFCSPHIGHO2_01_FULL_46_22b]